MEELQTEIETLKQKNKELEEKLKKYTNGENHKRYYEKKIKEHGSNNLKKLKEENPEKLKEYRRTYYLKRKERLKTEDNKLN